MNDDIMAIIEAAAAAADREGASFLLKSEVSNIALHQGLVLQTQLGLAKHIPLSAERIEYLRLQVQELVRIILTRELIGE